MKNLIINFEVNGKQHKIKIKPHWTLLHVIRNELGLKGTKFGCGTGECGACTVLVNGNPIRSCIMLAAQADGKKSQL